MPHPSTIRALREQPSRIERRLTEIGCAPTMVARSASAARDGRGVAVEGAWGGIDAPQLSAGAVAGAASPWPRRGDAATAFPSLAKVPKTGRGRAPLPERQE
jgi:hypothetical protein